MRRALAAGALALLLAGCAQGSSDYGTQDTTPTTTQAQADRAYYADGWARLTIDGVDCVVPRNTDGSAISCDWAHASAPEAATSTTTTTSLPGG